MQNRESRRGFVHAATVSLVLAVTLAPVAGSSPAEGDEELVEEMVEETMEVTSNVTLTTANRRPQPLLEVAEPVTILSEIQLLDTGGQTVKDVLSEQAGAGVVVDPGAGRGQVSINGVGNAGVLMLVDGRRYLGRDVAGNINLEDLDLSSVERIEVVKGAASALYGTDALGGVINLITRKAAAGTQNRLQLVAGSHNDLRVTDSFGHGGDRFDIALITSYRTFDGFDLDPVDLPTQGEPRSNRFDVQANSILRFSANVTGRIFANYSRREEKESFFSGATPLGPEVFDRRLDTERYTISPELDFVLSPSTSLDVRLTHSRYDRDQSDVFADRTETVQPWLEWNSEVASTLHHSWWALGQPQLLSAGYEFRHHDMDRATLHGPTADSPGVDRNLHSGRLHQELRLARWLTLTAGLRYDRDSEYGGQSSPQLSAVFATSHNTNLRGSWRKGFRLPGFNELFTEIPFFVAGNPDLEPETSETLSLGFTYLGRKASASTDYFDTELDNAIVFDLAEFIPPFTFTNDPRISTREGFNAEFVGNLPAGLTPSLAYTYLEAKDGTGENIGGTATHSGFFKLLWENPDLGLRANLRAEYRGEETPGAIDGSYTPQYVLWDLLASKTFFWGDHEVRLHAQIDNLFGKSDIFRRDASGLPLPEQLQVWEDRRSFHVGISFDRHRQRKGYADYSQPAIYVESAAEPEAPVLATVLPVTVKANEKGVSDYRGKGWKKRPFGQTLTDAKLKDGKPVVSKDGAIQRTGKHNLKFKLNYKPVLHKRGYHKYAVSAELELDLAIEINPEKIAEDTQEIHRRKGDHRRHSAGERRCKLGDHDHILMDYENTLTHEKGHISDLEVRLKEYIQQLAEEVMRQYGTPLFRLGNDGKAPAHARKQIETIENVIKRRFNSDINSKLNNLLRHSGKGYPKVDTERRANDAVRRKVAAQE